MKVTKTQLEYAALAAEIISAIAVVVTVIYMTVQIKDNTRALRNQGHYNALTLTQSPVTMSVNNGELARIVLTGNANPDSLEAVDRLRYTDHLFLSFNGWEYLYYANKAESIPVSLWEGADAYYGEMIMANPGLTAFWNEYKHAFAEPFHSYVEEFFQNMN